MKTALNFEYNETKAYLAKLDFEFFLKQNIEAENYSQADIDKVYSTYHQTTKLIRSKAKANKKQFNYYVEGQVRKMFTGGFLPALFELDESRGHTIFDFPGVGESWAYFKHWQTYQNRKVTKEKIWDRVVKTGSILAILLSLLKLFEFINQ
jgi:hypothetical protein